MSDLPRPSSHHPRRALLRGLRPLIGTGLRRYYDLRLHGTDNVPSHGPVIVASNHAGWLDGPLRTAPASWPRTREQTLATSALLWDHLREQQARALALVGRDLPGPLPPGDAEIEPDTGFVEHPDHHHDIAADTPADQQGAS